MASRVGCFCGNCGVAVWSYARRPKKFCSRTCYLKSSYLKAIAAEAGRKNKGRIGNNGNYPGGWNRGIPATGKALEALKIGWHLRGPDKPSWRGGVTPRHIAFRRSRAYQLWRRAVLDRDKACVLCGATEQLQADHIQPYSRYPEMGLDVANGRALCKPCHQQTDTYAGRMNRRTSEGVI